MTQTAGGTNVFGKIFSALLLIAALASAVLLGEYVVSFWRDKSTLQILYSLNILCVTIAGFLVAFGVLAAHKREPSFRLLALGCGFGALSSVWGVSYDLVNGLDIGLLTLDGAFSLLVYLILDVLYVVLNVLLMLCFFGKLKRKFSVPIAWCMFTVNILYIVGVVLTYVYAQDKNFGWMYPVTNVMAFMSSAALLGMAIKSAGR